MPTVLSIIVPFHKNLDQLRSSLGALRTRPRGAEVIVAADGAVDDPRPLAAECGARVVEIPGPSGPAVARNRAAKVARGTVLVFIDADVVAAPGSLARVAQVFDQRPDIAALFGAYDEAPGAPNFVSQYKNLAHRYIHQVSSPIAQTFWAGFGAVRADAFRDVGGFDERFRRPSVEDIDLGYRLTAAGYRVLCDAEIQSSHLKRWTVRSMIRSDVLDRGIPWTQLILKYGRFQNDLNLKSAYRACVVLSYLLVAALGLGVLVDPLFFVVAPLLVGALVYLGRGFYRFFLRTRGLVFLLRLFPLHVLYHLYNGLSFAIGTGLFLANRNYGLQFAWTLPLTAWERPSVQAHRRREGVAGTRAGESAQALGSAVGHLH